MRLNLWARLPGFEQPQQLVPYRVQQPEGGWDWFRPEVVGKTEWIHSSFMEVFGGPVRAHMAGEIDPVTYDRLVSSYVTRLQPLVDTAHRMVVTGAWSPLGPGIPTWVQMSRTQFEENVIKSLDSKFMSDVFRIKWMDYKNSCN